LSNKNNIEKIIEGMSHRRKKYRIVDGGLKYRKVDPDYLLIRKKENMELMEIIEDEEKKLIVIIFKIKQKRKYWIAFHTKKDIDFSFNCIMEKMVEESNYYYYNDIRQDIIEKWIPEAIGQLEDYEYIIEFEGSTY
jgi:hypothetical protein